MGLSNNLFNQKYFLVLWLWWFALIGRFARIMIPDLSRSILMRKARAWRLDTLQLTGAECFMLDVLADNLSHPAMDLVLEEVAHSQSRDTSIAKSTNPLV